MKAHKTQPKSKPTTKEPTEQKRSPQNNCFAISPRHNKNGAHKRRKVIENDVVRDFFNKRSRVERRELRRQCPKCWPSLQPQQDFRLLQRLLWIKDRNDVVECFFFNDCARKRPNVSVDAQNANHLSNQHITSRHHRERRYTHHNPATTETHARKDDKAISPPKKNHTGTVRLQPPP